MELTQRQTVILAILVLFAGKYLNKKIRFFQDYNIPEPVTGGVLASLLFGALYFLFDITTEFDLHARDVLLIVFFTTIGLSSRLSTLIAGGRTLLILLFAAVAYLFVQNMTGVAVTQLTGLPAQVGVVGGSVSLAGGHGTAIAWAPIFASEYGVSNAMEIGIACATFGLVFGGVVGGPVAKYLINKYKLKAEEEEPITVGLKYEQKDEKIDVNSLLVTILVIDIAVGIGIHLQALLEYLGLQLPAFVTALFAGILLTNTVPLLFPKMRWPTGTPTLALISDFSLGLFLAMSLMSLQLWTLIDLAGPILLLLLAQVAIICLFTVFFVFRILGKNYDAAVMSSGFIGLGLGATPTAIANMSAITKSCGPSHKAFLVVPLVGAFFIDIANAVIIKLMLRWVT